jgi:hypothetical protein
MRVRKRLVPTTKRIVEEDGKFCVMSEDGSRSFGCYATRDEASERLGQVEHYKVSDRSETEKTLPEVLTVEAVARGYMPEEGSGLPPSLEGDIPPEYRYWKAATRERKIACRDAFVESGKMGSILDVDGETRRVVTKLMIENYADEDAPLVSPLSPGLLGASMLSKTEGTVTVFELGTANHDELKKCERWIWVTTKDVKVEDLKATVHVFKVATRPEFTYLSNVAPIAHEMIIETRHAEKMTLKEFVKTSKSREVRLLKEITEERYALGIVLEPDVVDAQNDTYNEQEVRDAAHKYMENFAQVGLQHGEIVTGKVKILESYLAPTDFEVGAEKVKKGTWIMAVRADDDEIWKQIKEGSLTGFSIGGSAIRKPAT